MRRMYSEKELTDLIKKVGTDLIEAGEVENAKPIYCHAISILSNAEAPFTSRLTCLIFNNDSTPFTLATLKTWIDDLVAAGVQVRLLVSGGYSNDDASVVASYVTKSGSSYYIVGISRTDGYPAAVNGNWADIFPSASISFNDGVNKIN